MAFPALLVLRQKGRKNRLYIWVPGSSPRKRRFYGSEGDPEAVARYEYDRALWESRHRPPVPAPKTAPVCSTGGVCVADLIDAFMEHARAKYVKHGRPTGTADNYWQAIEPILLTYGVLDTADFTLDRLEEYQRDLDRSKRLCRRQVNKAITAICYVFTWGARHRINGERYVPAEIAAELRLIEPLRAGYAVSKDRPKKRAVSPSDVEAAMKHMTPTVRDMVEVQLLTGARPQEVRLMRAGDFERIDAALWHYRPREYKTEHIESDKIISCGPKAIAILRKRIRGKGPDTFIFKPEVSDGEHRKRVGAKVTRKTPSRQARDDQRAANPRRRFNACYRRDTYALAIKRACKRADVPVFSPYQLRKLRGTEIDRQFGAVAAQAVLGHANVSTTLCYYIDPRRDQADEIARKCG